MEELVKNVNPQYKILVTKLIPCICILSCLWFFFHNKQTTPLHDNSDLFTHLEIGDQDYGRFDYVEIHDFVPKDELLLSGSFIPTIHLKRNFITEKSVYQWALEYFSNRLEPQNITLIQKKRDGYEVARFLLKLSKPLSWSIESNYLNIGGFHEEVEISTQEIIRK